MCKHCDTILDVLRDAHVDVELELVNSPDEGASYGIVHVHHNPLRNTGKHSELRATALADAIEKICGKRAFVEVDRRSLLPLPSQRHGRG